MVESNGLMKVAECNGPQHTQKLRCNENGTTYINTGPLEYYYDNPVLGM